MTIEIREIGRKIEIKMIGQLIYSDMQSFRSSLYQIENLAGDSVEIDARSLDHIDSSGLRMFLLIFDACKSRGLALAVVGAHGQVKSLLLHSRFDTVARFES